MKSIVDLEIQAPRERVAELLADPMSSSKWMDDVERIEPIMGTLGAPGSKYRIVPKKGDMVFVATVVSKGVPGELKLHLDASSVAVSITDTLTPTSSRSTRLVSEEVFEFKGAVRKLFGLFASGAIKNAHRRHMEAFRRFVEAQGR